MADVLEPCSSGDPRARIGRYGVEVDAIDRLEEQKQENLLECNKYAG
jgi:hypothetical protein